MKTRRSRLAICLLLIPLAGLSAQIYGSREGDEAIAAKYTAWAESAIAEGRWSEARIVLERGADFANVSSDLTYLLAVTRAHFGEQRGQVLAALRTALSVDRWKKYTSGQARLFEAENLLAIKSWQSALYSLSLAGESPERARLALLALRFLPQQRQTFLRYTAQVFDRYPRETEPVRIFLDYLWEETSKGSLPNTVETELLDLVLERLPVLLPDDENLGWMAAPFMRDPAEAVRYVSAYRAVHTPTVASLPVALGVGVVDEARAVEELFADSEKVAGLDVSLIKTVWDLLSTQAARDSLGGNLSSYTGVLIEDYNRDGRPEAETEYVNGVPLVFRHDENQDGIPELVVNFAAGNPASAVVVLPPDPQPDYWHSPGLFAVVPDERQLEKITLRWERYPALSEVQWADERFIPRPLSLNFTPIQFVELSHPQFVNERYAEQGFLEGLLVPQFDAFTPALTRHMLIANSLRVERPSVEFAGAVETVELNMSIPMRAWEYLDGRLISQTEFLRGRPQTQRVDLDFDGRLETTRFFRRFSLVDEDGLAPIEALLDYPRLFEYAESDWTGDEIIETYTEDW